MNWLKLIDLYLDSKQLAWAPTSIKSERSRLNKLVRHMDLEPLQLYQELVDNKRKPYTIKTTFIRLAAFYKWLIAHEEVQGPNPYANFLETHRRLFKHAYQKETQLDITYAEAKCRIESIRDNTIRERALEILYAGMRFSESNTVEGNSIIGKGGKRRRVYLPKQITTGQGKDQRVKNISYHNFWKKLKAATGLKPHTLRKLAATRLVEAGASSADLMEIMGWSNLQTASFYLQSKREDKLEQLMESKDGN